MIHFILCRSGQIEVFVRKILNLVKPLKHFFKRKMNNGKKTNPSNIQNEVKIDLLKKKLSEIELKDNDIILIHSSMDGLQCLGMSADEIIDLVLGVFHHATVVLAAFPIEPTKEKQLYKYNPVKTLCWTGILPNAFLRKQGVIRSSFPYNSLAAKGERAEEMMKDSIKGLKPHDGYSAWEYCRRHNAKILFLGTTSRSANTMAIHMLPDMVGEEWPIENWYKQRNYQITLGDKVMEKEVLIQDGFWYQYVNEYRTDKLLKDNGLLYDIGFDEFSLEYVPDCGKMMEFLHNNYKNGRIMYSIPRRYYKK